MDISKLTNDIIIKIWAIAIKEKILEGHYKGEIIDIFGNPYQKFDFKLLDRKNNFIKMKINFFKHYFSWKTIIYKDIIIKCKIYQNPYCSEYIKPFENDNLCYEGNYIQIDGYTLNKHYIFDSKKLLK